MRRAWEEPMCGWKRLATRNVFWGNSRTSAVMPEAVAPTTTPASTRVATGPSRHPRPAQRQRQVADHLGRVMDRQR